MTNLVVGGDRGCASRTWPKSMTAKGTAGSWGPALGLEVGSGQSVQALCAGDPVSAWSSELCGHPRSAHVTDEPLRERVGTALRTEPTAEQSSVELRALFLALHKGRPRHFWGHWALLATRQLCPRGLGNSLQPADSLQGPAQNGACRATAHGLEGKTEGRPCSHPISRHKEKAEGRVCCHLFPR